MDKNTKPPYEAKRGHWWRFGFIVYQLPSWGFQKGVWTFGLNLGRLSVWYRYKKDWSDGADRPIPWRYR